VLTIFIRTSWPANLRVKAKALIPSVVFGASQPLLNELPCSVKVGPLLNQSGLGSIKKHTRDPMALSE
jgi:hypothetical protein